VTWRRRTAILALACAAASASAVTALTAMDKGGDPPIVHGPLALNDQACFQKGPGFTCAFDYVLDRSATNDPADEWHAFWVSSDSAEPARHGFCTIEVVNSLVWGSAATPTRTSPPAGPSSAGPGVSAHLAVDAAGHALVPASLDQQPAWPAGLLSSTPGTGRLTVLWQGATTRTISFSFGAEIVNPEGSPQSSGGDQYEVGVPCAHVGPPGPGFRARIRPAVSRPGRPAYVQVRIPGTHIKPGPLIRPGIATIAIGSGRPVVLEVVGRTALSLPARRYGLYPGRYVVRVKLRGPTGSRRYRLRLDVR
jgi:hypothetical protein